MAGSGAKGGKVNTGPSLGTHPRYIPKRGGVLKRILRGLFRLAPPGGAAAGKVSPAPANGRKKPR